VARRGFFGNLFKTIRETFTPSGRQEKLDREARRFARGQQTSARAAERYAQQRRDAEVTRRAGERRRAAQRRREREADPYERIWRENQPGRRLRRRQFEGQRRVFRNIRGLERESDEDLEALWESYVENMVYGRHGYRFNDIRNPFWEDANMDPRDFDWAAWRRWRDTPR